MQISKILRVSSEQSSDASVAFQLSGVLSEWLFAIRFWREFNTAHGTMFDQFEEDEVDASIVKLVSTALAKQIAALRSTDMQSVEFVYRRRQDGQPLTADTPKAALLSELTALHDFLNSAAEQNLTLIFDL